MASTQVEHNNYGKTLEGLLDKHIEDTPGNATTFRHARGSSQVDAKDANDNRVVLERRASFHHLKSVEKIVDPDSKRTILLSNVVGYSPRNGQMVPDIGPLAFEGKNLGVIEVPHTDRVMLARMLFSDKCKDNPSPTARRPDGTPRRAGDGGYLYEVVKPDADASRKADNYFARAQALELVKDLKEDDDLDELQAVCGKLALPIQDHSRQLTAGELVLSLAELAEKEPTRVTLAITSQEAKLEQLIEEALKLDVLDFNTEARQWRYKATQELIVPAVHDIKAAQALVGYIQQNSEGVEFSQRLVALVAAAKKKPKKGKKGATPNPPAS